MRIAQTLARANIAKRTATVFAVSLFFIAPVTILSPQAREGVYPHPESSLEYRITNRRYISHIAYESNEEGHFVTILTTHPGVWAFHANSHALHYACEGPRECLRVIRKLNDFLQTGWNIGLRLNGSKIKEIIFFEQP
ncbi:MAG: hypothetical protein NXI24_15290 [bacterium]|nr:hypothetical protein [bacterium]